MYLYTCFKFTNTSLYIVNSFYKLVCNTCSNIEIKLDKDLFEAISLYRLRRDDGEAIEINVSRAIWYQ